MTVNLHEYTEASLMSLTAAASTMFLITNFLMALSLGTHRAQFVHLTAFTWPRPCLARPPLRRLRVWKQKSPNTETTCFVTATDSDACTSSHLANFAFIYTESSADIQRTTTFVCILCNLSQFFVSFVDIFIKYLPTMFLTSESVNEERRKRTFST